MTENLDLTPEQHEEILDIFKEVSGALARTEGEKDFIKAQKETLKDLLKLSSKEINRLVKTYHKGTFKNETQDDDRFRDVYTKLVPSATQQVAE